MLIFSNGDVGRFIKEDVGGLEDWVCEETELELIFLAETFAETFFTRGRVRRSCDGEFGLGDR